MQFCNSADEIVIRRRSMDPPTPCHVSAHRFFFCFFLSKCWKWALHERVLPRGLSLRRGALERFLVDDHSGKVESSAPKKPLPIPFICFHTLVCFFRWDQKWQGRELTVFESHFELFCLSFFPPPTLDGVRVVEVVVVVGELNCRCQV